MKHLSIMEEPKKLADYSRKYKEKLEAMGEDAFLEWADELYVSERDTEFEKQTGGSFKKKVKVKLDSLSADWDLTGPDLKSNDLITLENLATAMVTLDEFNKELSSHMEQGIGIDNINIVERISKVMEGLRSDISKMQDDLKITRKSRKADEKKTALELIDTIKDTAKKFYEQKMLYFYCPKCKTLLATGWFLYPDGKLNEIKLRCERRTENGEPCNTDLVLKVRNVYHSKGTNNQNIPETLK